MILLLALGLLALGAGADDWECPKHCHCLPDHQLPDKFKLSCTRPGVWGPASLFDIQAARVSSLRQTCPPGAKPSLLEPDTFLSFPHLRHLTLRDCRLNQSSLPRGLLAPLKQLHTLRLERLSGTGDGLGVDSGLFGPLEKTDLISLSGSGITHLPGGALCHLQDLKMLNLSHNRLGNLGAAGFLGADHCRTNILVLDLSHNEIQALKTGDFDNFPQLREASLHNNAIQRLGRGVFPVASVLRSLRMDSNDIREVDELPQSLTQLEFSNNSLLIIPQAVSDAPNLISLNLSHNSLDGSTPFFLDNPSLVTLDLSSNDFTDLPVGLLANASGLEYLYLSNNQVRDLHDAQFASLAQLRLLDLRNNSLTTLAADALSGLGRLESLLLSNNSVATLDGELFSSLPILHTLDLAFNLLLDVPSQFTKLYHLSSLDLGHNQISSVTKFLFDKLPNLRYLSLAGNRLAQVERYSFEDIAALEVLDLSDNHIETLEPLCFDRNHKLSSLHLDRNLITAMEDVFQGLSSLKFLNLTQNAITFMDYGMLPESLERLSMRLNYLTALTNIRTPSPLLSLTDIDLSFNNLSFLNNYSIPRSLQRANFSNNRIAAIETRTLLGKMGLEWVDVRGNGIRGLGRESLRIEEGDAESGAVLWLSGNPLECSCELEWMKKRMEKAQRVRMPSVGDYEALVCTQPHSGKPALLRSLHRSQLLCPYRLICSADCLCCDFDACDCKSLCPDSCSCFHDSAYQENIVHCSNSRHAPVKPREIPMHATQIYVDGGRMPRIESNAFLGRLKLKQLYLNGSGVRQIDAKAFSGLTSLELLDLSDNHLEEVRGDEFSKLSMLRHLFLNGNAIRSLRDDALDDLPALQSLTLHNNQMKLLPPALIGRPLAALTLGGNPFLCDCGEPFAIQPWLPQHTSVVKDSDAVYCAQDTRAQADGLNHTTLAQSTILTRFPPSGEDGLIKVNFWTLRKELNRTLCGGASITMDASNPEWELFGLSLSYLIPLGILGLVLLLGTCLILIIAATRKRIHKAPGGSLKIRKGPGSLNSSGTATTPVPLISNDAFVTYGVADTDWVLRELAGRLEGEPPFHSLCLLHRDLPTPVAAFHHYHLVNDDIAHAMRRSLALIMVISPSFLHHEWEMTQIKIAHLCHLKEKSSKLIFIVLGEVRLESVDPMLGQYLRHNTLLHAAHPLFWDQLREALPCRTTDSLLSSSDPEYSHLYYGPIVPSGFL